MKRIAPFISIVVLGISTTAWSQLMTSPAAPGKCADGMVVIETTTSGVKCAVAATSDGGGGGTTYTGVKPIVVSGSNISVGVASATDSGILTNADWSTFNNKLGSVSGTFPIKVTGGSAISVAVAGATDSGILTSTDWNTFNTKLGSVSGTFPIEVAGGSAISIAVASATDSGILTSADWSTFNNKLGSVTATAPLVSDGGNVSMPAAAADANGYLTSTDWSTFNSKADPVGLASITDAGLIGVGINQSLNGNFSLVGDAGVSKNLTVGGDINMGGSINNTLGWVYSDFQGDYMGTASTQRQFCATDWGTGLPCFMMYPSAHMQDGGVLQSWQPGASGYTAPWVTIETGGRLTAQDLVIRDTLSAGDAGFTKDVSVAGVLNVTGDVHGNNFYGYTFNSNFIEAAGGTYLNLRAASNGVTVPGITVSSTATNDGGSMMTWGAEYAGGNPRAIMEQGGRLTIQDLYSRNTIVADGGVTAPNLQVSCPAGQHVSAIGTGSAPTCTADAAGGSGFSFLDNNITWTSGLRLGGYRPTSTLVVHDVQIEYTTSGTVTNSWLDAGFEGTARQQATPVRLADGRIISVGGCDTACTTYPKTVDIYTPSTGAWATTGGLDAGRIQHSLTHLNDDRVLLCGGQNGGGIPTNECEIWNPDGGQWSVVTPMAVPRYVHAATLLNDGRVLVAGGYSGAANIAYSEIYNPTNDTWVDAGPMQSPRRVHALATLLDGGVLAAGGYTSANTEVAELWTEAGGWSATNSMNVPRARLSLVTLNSGLILAVGGAADGGNTNSAETFNPATDIWTLTSNSMADIRAYFNVAKMSDGRVVVAGGNDGVNVLKSASIYDPAGNSWSALPDMSNTRQQCGVIVLASDQLLTIAGVQTGGAALASAERLATNSPIRLRVTDGTNICDCTSITCAADAGIPWAVTCDGGCSMAANGNVSVTVQSYGGCTTAPVGFGVGRVE